MSADYQAGFVAGWEACRTSQHHRLSLAIDDCGPGSGIRLPFVPDEDDEGGLGILAGGVLEEDLRALGPHPGDDAGPGLIDGSGRFLCG